MLCKHVLYNEKYIVPLESVGCVGHLSNLNAIWVESMQRSTLETGFLQACWPRKEEKLAIR